MSPQLPTLVWSSCGHYLNCDGEDDKGFMTSLNSLLKQILKGLYTGQTSVRRTIFYLYCCIYIYK